MGLKYLASKRQAVSKFALRVRSAYIVRFLDKFLKNLQPKPVFWILVGLTYVLLFFASGQLQDPFWADEHSFYATSQKFSHQLIPSLDQLKNYNELNTPLPFILFGQIQYLFQGGLFGGRLLNFVMSIVIAILIGWPGRKQRFVPILALIGLFLYPYFLWFSTRYYTDIIAAFFTLLGIAFYLKRWHILSGLVFILAIATRQYMLAFPLAVASHELVIAIQAKKRPSLSFFLPAIAALSILGWFMLFGGLAPSNSFEAKLVPPVQQSLLAIAPSHGLYALADIGLFYVMPEWLLFGRSFDWKTSLTRTRIAIAASLIALCIIFPIPQFGKGVLWKIFQLPPIIGLQSAPLYCGLVLVAGWRFSRVNLSFWLVLYHVLIMMKAFPWDKYTLPILVVLWFLKARNNNEDLTPCSKDV